MKAKKDEEISVDCYCQIMCNLSDGDASSTGSCNCSDCLQAMAQAYNEFLKDSQRAARTRTVQNNTTQKSNPNTSPSKTIRSTQKHTSSHDRCTRCTRWGKHDHHSHSNNHIDSFNQSEQESELKEMVERVNVRMQENLQKHRELRAQQIKEKEEYMRKIKEDLEKLKYRARIEVEKKEGKDPFVKGKIWNYKPCAELTVIPSQCFEGRHREKIKAETNTGRVDFEKLGQHKFLRDLKRRIQHQYRKSKLRHKNKKAHCEYDICDKHHMRTTPQHIQEAAEKIKDRAKKYTKKIQKQKQQKEDKQKLTQARLKGLALQAKRKLQMSKRQTVDSEKSSFKLYLDHFSTFSQMRERKQLEQQEKKREKQMQERISKQQQRAPPREGGQIKVYYEKQIEKPRSPQSQRQQSPRYQAHKSSSKKIQQPEVREQQIERVRQSMREQPLLIKPQAGRPVPQQQNKFYEWDLPIDEDKMKNIFQEAKLTQPPGAKKKKGKETKQIQSRKKQQKQQQEEVVQNVTKKKMKQRLEDRLLRERKQELERKLKKNKEEQLQLYQERRQKVYEKHKPTKKPKAASASVQPRYPAPPMPSFEPPQYNRKDPYGHVYQTYNKVGDSDALAEGKIHVQDPIVDKVQFDEKKRRINNLEHVLLDNDFLSDEDKKVFILNYRALVKEKGLAV